MSVTLSYCPSFAAAPESAPRGRPATGRGVALLGASIALAIGVAAAVARPTAPLVPYEAAMLVAGHGTSAAVLLGAAETVRARLLQASGVGAVDVRGLQPGGLEVDYAPARLARFGLTATDLLAALPVQADRSSPGRLAIRQEAAQSGPQPIADLPVRAGHRVLRLGDVATVARTALPSPVATLPQGGALRQGGGLAVELVVIPANGADGTLARRVAASLARAALPGDIRVR